MLRPYGWKVAPDLAKAFMSRVIRNADHDGGTIPQDAEGGLYRHLNRNAIHRNRYGAKLDVVHHTPMYTECSVV